MRLQHVSLAYPPGTQDEVRAFYGGVLGLREIPVLPKLEPGRFVWFHGGSGDLELHLMEAEVLAGKHHACLAVDDDLDGLRDRLEAGGYEVSDATEIVGRPRFFCRDPFGNLLELCRISA